MSSDVEAREMIRNVTVDNVVMDDVPSAIVTDNIIGWRLAAEYVGIPVRTLRQNLLYKQRSTAHPSNPYIFSTAELDVFKDKHLAKPGVDAVKAISAGSIVGWRMAAKWLDTPIRSLRKAVQLGQLNSVKDTKGRHIFDIEHLSNFKFGIRQPKSPPIAIKQLEFVLPPPPPRVTDTLEAIMRRRIVTSDITVSFAEPSTHRLTFCYFFQIDNVSPSITSVTGTSAVNLMKIGASANVEARCRQILGGLSRQAKHVGINFSGKGTIRLLLLGDVDTERRLHDMFKAYQVPIEIDGSVGREFFLADPVMDFLVGNNLV